MLSARGARRVCNPSCSVFLEKKRATGGGFEHGARVVHIRIEWGDVSDTIINDSAKAKARSMHSAITSFHYSRLAARRCDRWRLLDHFGHLEGWADVVKRFASLGDLGITSLCLFAGCREFNAPLVQLKVDNDRDM